MLTNTTSSKTVVLRAIKLPAAVTTLRTLHGKAGLSLFVALCVSNQSGVNSDAELLKTYHKSFFLFHLCENNFTCFEWSTNLL
jgi:hypothetical protein